MTLNLIEEMPEIRPFPQVATQIIAACESPDTSPQQLNDIIQCDPSIAMRVVQVANSSAYGFAGEVRTISHAIVVLGFKSLKNLVLSAAARDVFASSANDKRARQHVWQHSLGWASVASLLADLTDSVSRDEAFLAAIVHDVGKLVLIEAARDEYHDQTVDVGGDAIIGVENELFGTDHQELGERCADEWGLPFDIADAIASHHGVFEPNDNAELVNLIGLSDGIARSWELGTGSNELDIDQLLENTQLGFDRESIDLLQEQASSRFEELQRAFAF